MIARIFAQAISKLSRKRPDPRKQAYADAYGAYQNACRRGDTRDQGAAWQRLRSALNDNLKAEIRPAPAQWRGSR